MCVCGGIREGGKGRKEHFGTGAKQRRVDWWVDQAWEVGGIGLVNIDQILTPPPGELSVTLGCSDLCQLFH